MSSSLSPPRLRFLLDENVHKRLGVFLKSGGFDVIFCPKGISNGELSAYSKSERRILVTNDSDLSLVSKERVFSVIWLRIPQNESESLLKAFSNLLKEKNKLEDFEGKLIVLNKEEFEVSILSTPV